MGENGCQGRVVDCRLAGMKKAFVVGGSSFCCLLGMISSHVAAEDIPEFGIRFSNLNFQSQSFGGFSFPGQTFQSSFGQPTPNAPITFSTYDSRAVRRGTVIANSPRTATGLNGSSAGDSFPGLTNQNVSIPAVGDRRIVSNQRRNSNSVSYRVLAGRTTGSRSQILSVRRPSRVASTQRQVSQRFQSIARHRSPTRVNAPTARRFAQSPRRRTVLSDLPATTRR